MMFEESINSAITRKKYIYLVTLFKDYYKIKDFDGIIKIGENELQKMVETYVIHIKKSINPNTMPTYINPIKTFLEVNDIDLNWRKIKRLYPAKVKRSGNSAYQTEDVKLMLEVTPQIRNKALIHFLASTGCRVGAIQDLKLRHLRDMPLDCKMVLIYEDSTEEYVTFLTPEATKALDLYLDERKSNGEIMNDENPLFRERYQLAGVEPNPISTEAIQGVLGRTMKNANLRGQKKNGRYAEQLAHGFRKRFNTILKLNNQVNDNAIEKMMGHTNGLDGSYLQITDEKLFEEFKKGIMDLTVSDDERDKAKIKELENEKSELESLKIQNENWEKNFDDKVNDKLSEKINDVYSMMKEELPRVVEDFYAKMAKEKNPDPENFIKKNSKLYDKLAKENGIEDIELTRDEAISDQNKLIKKLKKKSN